MTIETLLYVIVSVFIISSIFFIIAYYLILKKLFKKNTKYFSDFIKSFIIGIAGGFVVYFAIKIEGFLSGSDFDIIDFIILFFIAILGFLLIMTFGVLFYITVSKSINEK